MKTFHMALAVAGLGLVSTAALAGARTTADLRIDDISARGSIGGIRNNPTTTDEIGCTVNTISGPLRIECFATKGTVTKRCFSDDPRNIAAGYALSDSSWIWFRWDPGTGECVFVDAYNSSLHMPRQP